MGEKTYNDCIYLKDGCFMKRDFLGNYIKYDEVPKKSVFEAIEMFMAENPTEFKIGTIINSALKKLFKVSKYQHIKVAIPGTKEKVNDSLYTELVEYVQNSKTYHENFEDVIYIKDGNFMKQHIDGEFYVFSSVTKKDVFDCIEMFLAANPTEMNLKFIIKQSTKQACNVSRFKHVQIPTRRNKQQLLTDDPLYSELIAFIQNSSLYKKRIEEAEVQRAKDKIAYAEIRKKKDLEVSLNGFFIESTKTHISRKNLRKF